MPGSRLSIIQFQYICTIGQVRAAGLLLPMVHIMFKDGCLDMFPTYEIFWNPAAQITFRVIAPTGSVVRLLELFNPLQLSKGSNSLPSQSTYERFKTKLSRCFKVGIGTGIGLSYRCFTARSSPITLYRRGLGISRWLKPLLTVLTLPFITCS